MSEESKSAETDIPTFACTTLARPELYERLDAAVATAQGHAVLISAPAGSGKTVLIADWIGSRLHPSRVRSDVRWLTMTRENSGAATLRAALGPSAAGPPALLIIDNAHLITDPPALAYLEHVLTHLPASTTAVISARFAPPLRWHAVEQSQLVTYLRTADLAFTPTRVRQLCAERECVLTDAELGAVMQLTHGWPALVRIAVGHLAAGGDRQTALAELADTPRAVADFLFGECVDELPEQVRRFVVDTSVPATFSAALAEQLTDLDAHQILDGLLRINFPLRHAARGGELWFSYHPMLRTQLLAESRYGARHPEVNRRTADWYSAMNMPMAALPHVLAGTATELVCFLRELGLRVVLDGDGPRLFRQLEQAGTLPVDDPYLWVLRSIDALERRDVGTAVTHLELVCERASNTETLAPHGWIVPLTLAATAATAVATGVGLAEINVPEHLPVTGQADIDSYVALEVAAVLLARGDFHGGRRQLRRGLALAKCVGNHRLVLRSTARLAISIGVLGGVSVARDMAARAVRIASARHLGDSADARAAQSVSSYIGFLRGETGGEASSRQPECGGVVTQLRAVWSGADKYAAAVSLRASSAALLRHARALPAVAGLLLPHVIRALLEVNDAHTVRPLIDQAEGIPGVETGSTLARAIVAAVTEHPKTVLGLVEPILGAPDPVHPVHMVTALLLVAAAHAALRNPVPAKAAVEAALRVAEPDHIVRPFVEITGVVELLDAHTGTFGRHNGYVEQIRHHPAVRRGAAPPRLTVTERTVLHQLPSGQTTQQIAESLGVSINTIKTHLRGIYAKLGTTSRAETLVSARRTGLL
ncbi:LuxR C-terminal-related transcriptional regulator [Nocardia goodfellowii]|uniref:LuxR family maltose regulon positive regulatory protein n=1 Tax=Nocardia goodfellowii TaxID=882446 RepID=A0ABS4QMX2_9NOCA|nr:LuxR C-terminal-related transcriptional regulator [Nocardia goodfellowii]MBP2193047.1 LuxR family maltose regulon positive regulatory protein [Nocardia goodfellowii]